MINETSWVEIGIGILATLLSTGVVSGVIGLLVQLISKSKLATKLHAEEFIDKLGRLAINAAERWAANQAKKVPGTKKLEKATEVMNMSLKRNKLKLTEDEKTERLEGLLEELKQEEKLQSSI